MRLWLLPVLLFGVSDQCFRRRYPGPDPVGFLLPNTAAVYTSTLDGERLSRSTVQFGRARREKSDILITISPTQSFQSIIGFGGAFTDSTGINLLTLSEATRKRAMESYFGENGLSYSLGRVPIASTDFSTREYSYLDNENDFELNSFNLTEDDHKYKIPFILSALSLSPSLRLFASPWSAPAWMKSNGRMAGGGRLKEGERYQETWAQYFVRFFSAYLSLGISFWGMTIQNEPTSGSIPDYKWQTMYFSSTMQRDFVKSHLGPALASNNATKNLKVMGLDDNRLFLPSFADTIYSDPLSSSFVHGMGVHWYMNRFTPVSLLDVAAGRWPHKFILATEACSGYSLSHGVILGDWARAEWYAHDIIETLNHHVSGWMDWNLALDTQGGPTWVGNFVDAPLIVNSTADEFYKQPTFHAMGHFSKFIRPGARRVLCTVSDGWVEAAAVTLKGRRTVVILNRTSEERSVTVREEGASARSLALTLPPRSINTLVWDKL